MSLPEQAITTEEPKPTPAENFRAMVRKIHESRDSQDPEQAIQLGREARQLARVVLNSLDSMSSPDKRALDAVIYRTVWIDPVGGDIYRVMHNSTRAVSALRIRRLLWLREHGPIDTIKRGGVY